MKSRSFLYHNMEDEELLHKAASIMQLQDMKLQPTTATKFYSAEI
jgi:hypothetical protein